MTLPNLLAAGAAPLVPETLARAPGLALKALSVPEGAGPHRLDPPGQGFLLIVLEGALRYGEQGRTPADLRAGEGWFQPGDRSATVEGIGPGHARCLLISTPVPDREPRRLGLLERLGARLLPLPLLVHRNESVVIEARHLRGRLPLRGRTGPERSDAPRFHVLLAGAAAAALGDGPEIPLGPGDLLEVPARTPARLRAVGGSAFLLSVEALKGRSAPGSPRGGAGLGVQPLLALTGPRAGQPGAPGAAWIAAGPTLTIRPGPARAGRADRPPCPTRPAAMPASPPPRRHPRRSRPEERTPRPPSRPWYPDEDEAPPPPRERTVHPTFDIGGRPTSLLRPGGWLLLALLALVLAVSILHARTFAIEVEGTRAVFTRGDFWLWGRSPYSPRGAEEAFRSVPYTEPPAGTALSGSLREAANAWYAMVYRVALAAEREPDLFARYDRQAAAVERWYQERFGHPPALAEAMNGLRQRMRRRAEEVAAYRQARQNAIQAVKDALAKMPDEDRSAAMREERLLYERFLREMADVVQ